MWGPNTNKFKNLLKILVIVNNFPVSDSYVIIFIFPQLQFISEFFVHFFLHRGEIGVNKNIFKGGHWSEFLAFFSITFFSSLMEQVMQVRLVRFIRFMIWQKLKTSSTIISFWDRTDGHLDRLSLLKTCPYF